MMKMIRWGQKPGPFHDALEPEFTENDIKWYGGFGFITRRTKGYESQETPRCEHFVKTQHYSNTSMLNIKGERPACSNIDLYHV